MKNTIKLIGIIATMAIIGFIAISCGNDHTCSFGSWTTKTEATCHTAEVQVRTCSCGEEETRSVGSPNEDFHVWGELIQTTDPTCTEEGEKIQTCTYATCDAVNQATKESVPIDENAHDAGAWRTTLEATCVAKGNRVLECTRCDHILETDNDSDELPIVPTNHLWTNYIFDNNATCKDGTETAICDHATCYVEDTRTKVGTALGHDFDWVIETSWGMDTEKCQNAPCTKTRNIRLTKNIGDTGPAGGIIFYRDPAGFTVQGYSGGSGTTAHLNFTTYTAHYLEAAPENMETTLMWASNRVDLIPGLSQDFFGELSMIDVGIGRGRMNTAIIITRGMTYTTPYTTPAASACIALTTGGKTGWFLPSSNELNALALISGLHGIPNTGWFWSSSQFEGHAARSQSFAGGSGSHFKDNDNNEVRAVRAF